MTSGGLLSPMRLRRRHSYTAVAYGGSLGKNKKFTYLTVLTGGLWLTPTSVPLKEEDEAAAQRGDRKLTGSAMEQQWLRGLRLGDGTAMEVEEDLEGGRADDKVEKGRK
ncbi:hypothetical protein Fmac_028797 [Flemingia macrophylla]|uniref:Uncharacterized protein n=1 Tax=Flemingia macrophylla TaxID=520843 RepID=A0ABD1L8I8_9FABA